MLVAAGCTTLPDNRQNVLQEQALPIETWAQSPAAQKDAEPPIYRLQVGDSIDLRFAYATELNDTVTVRPDGRISMAWVGDIQAAGRTPGELTQDLTNTYRRVLREPRVDVIVRTFRPQRVYFAGEVARPGEVEIVGPMMTALQAIARVGDFTPDARRESVIVIRQSGRPDPDFILLDFATSPEERARLASTNPCGPQNPLACDGIKPMRIENFRLQPMDVVFVPKTRVAGVAQFFERYVSQILPIYRNIGLSFTYPLRRDTVVIPAQN